VQRVCRTSTRLYAGDVGGPAGFCDGEDEDMRPVVVELAEEVAGRLRDDAEGRADDGLEEEAAAALEGGVDEDGEREAHPVRQG
jgi:hypothetical protein